MKKAVAVVGYLGVVGVGHATGLHFSAAHPDTLATDAPAMFGLAATLIGGLLAIKYGVRVVNKVMDWLNK